MSINRAAQISAVIALFAAGGFAVSQQTTATEQDQLVHVNQIQVIGSHNSYHSGFPPSARKYMEMNYPKALHSLDYSHPPLQDQLSAGVRQIEIDVMRMLRADCIRILPFWIELRRQAFLRMRSTILITRWTSRDSRCFTCRMWTCAAPA